jgi:DNA ligase 1
MPTIPYSKIASCLEEARNASRSQRQTIVAEFLSTVPPGLLCPSVRLLTGELWPSWEGCEMGVGPQMISSALEELTSEDVGLLRTSLGDMGQVAEKALQSKSQNSLSLEPLDAMDVYGSLLRVSKHMGPSSEYRKESILRGLFLNASPLEARYIARTLSRNTACGLGPQTMISALALAFSIEAEQVREAHSRMPDLGALAQACSKGCLELQSVRIKPGVPVRPMIIPPGEGTFPDLYLARYPGLRVQVHIWDCGFAVYTMSLKDISTALQVLDGQHSFMGRQIIAEADLVCFQEGRMQSQSEVVRYVNREHNSRRLSTSPMLIVDDLLFLDGQDVTGLAYSQRRQKLQSILVPVEPEPGIYLAEEVVLEDAQSVLTMSRERGFAGFAYRNPDDCYRPGKMSTSDFAIKATQVISAAIMGVQYDDGMTISSCLLALKSGSDYAPVGWATLSSGMRDDLEDMVGGQATEGESLEISPQAVVRVRISGARYKDGQWHLASPRIIEARFGDEADDLEKLRLVMER